jgi:hypothetical protein
MKHDPLKCGECGCDTFKLEHHALKEAPRVGGGPVDCDYTIIEGHVVVICTQCGNKSKLGVTPAYLGVHVEGNLCGGWK